MTREQYLRLIEREIQEINKKIDHKILRGESYRKEAHDHKLLLQKIRMNARRNFWDKFFPTFSRKAF